MLGALLSFFNFCKKYIFIGAYTYGLLSFLVFFGLFFGLFPTTWLSLFFKQDFLFRSVSIAAILPILIAYTHR